MQKNLISLFTLCCKLTCDRFTQLNSQKKSPNVENKCWGSYETLESTSEMRLMDKMLPVYNVSELWNLFPQPPMFMLLFQANIYSLTF